MELAHRGVYPSFPPQRCEFGITNGRFTAVWASSKWPCTAETSGIFPLLGDHLQFLHRRYAIRWVKAAMRVLGTLQKPSSAALPVSPEVAVRIKNILFSLPAERAPSALAKPEAPYL